MLPDYTDLECFSKALNAVNVYKELVYLNISF